MASFLPQHLPDIPLPDPTSTSSLRTIHDFFLSSFYTQEKCTQLLDSYVRPTRNWGKGWDGNSFCNHQEKHVVEWNRTPFQVLTALFLFGEELSKDICASVLSPSIFELLVSHKFLKRKYVSCYSSHQIFPVTVGSRTALILTDWPFLDESLPSQFAVMPVGYDSLELTVISEVNVSSSNAGECSSICDMCCGSGIQGIHYLLQLVSTNQNLSSVKCKFVDYNPRALSLCEFNVAFNGLSSASCSFVKSDCWSDVDASADSKFDVILCNPPFVAIPESEEERLHYYADGGVDGNNAIKEIFKEVLPRLKPLTGVMLMVTELPNVSTSTSQVRRFLASEEGKIKIAYVKEDVETIEEYSAVRNDEMGFKTDAKKYAKGINKSEDIGVIIDRALVLIRVENVNSDDDEGLFEFSSGQDEDVEYEFGADEPDAFIGDAGRSFLAEVMK
ncbi:hypothetical protein TrVE_jg6649 [Triparma verrucosa]|uniref:Methyltransferase small domain-containing protein n=1 Tax=Triparma verrucosa TaxID=1606542 RepID=A0A9W7C298_9STRA|nr:hypothetical protein TrVE_jg6649 [Triparma verrucosa]